MIEAHEKTIREHEEKIAEQQNKEPDLSRYSSKKSEEVLAYRITCTYSMNDLSGNNFTEKSEFILSPDGSRVYEARRIKD